MRKVYLKVTVGVIVNADDDTEIQDIVDDLSVEGNGEVEGYDIEDTEIRDWELEDSK